jgi:threonine/homoserine/homoserine lactone efflux protein
VAPGNLLGFAVAALVIIAVPGPSVLFVVSRGVTLGRRAALATVVGNTLGELLLACLVAFGVGGIIATSDTVFTVVKIVGACYLVWLGWRHWRRRAELGASLRGVVARKSVPRIVREGFIVGFTNPKTAVFFAAVLPQFVDHRHGAAPLQMVVLAFVFAAIAVISDGTWGLAAGSVRAWLTRRPERLEVVGGVGGLAIMALGVRLALTGRRD